MQLSSFVIDRTGYLYLTCLNRSSFITALNLTEPTTISYSIVDYLIQYWRLATSTGLKQSCVRVLQAHACNKLFISEEGVPVPPVPFLPFVYKATPYNSHRHAYNSQPSGVTSTKQPSRLQFTPVTPTKQPPRLQFTAVTSTIHNLFCRRDGCEF